MLFFYDKKDLEWTWHNINYMDRFLLPYLVTAL